MTRRIVRPMLISILQAWRPQMYKQLVVVQVVHPLPSWRSQMGWPPHMGVGGGGREVQQRRHLQLCLCG